MDDISQGSSLYATSQLKLLHEDKETQLLLLAFGGAGPPPAYLAEERTGLCDKDTHTEAEQVRTAGLLQLQLLQHTNVSNLAAGEETKVIAGFNDGKAKISFAATPAGQDLLIY